MVHDAQAALVPDDLEHVGAHLCDPLIDGRHDGRLDALGLAHCFKPFGPALFREPCFLLFDLAAVPLIATFDARLDGLYVSDGEVALRIGHLIEAFCAVVHREYLAQLASLDEELRVLGIAARTRERLALR